MKKINKLVLVLFLFVVSLAYADVPDLPAPTTAKDGIGGGGPGAVASPIDMYVYALSVIAIVFIVFFTKKYKIQKI